jgi:hypothetical protein
MFEEYGTGVGLENMSYHLGSTLLYALCFLIKRSLFILIRKHSAYCNLRQNMFLKSHFGTSTVSLRYGTQRSTDELIQLLDGWWRGYSRRRAAFLGHTTYKEASRMSDSLNEPLKRKYDLL